MTSAEIMPTNILKMNKLEVSNGSLEYIQPTSQPHNHGSQLNKEQREDLQKCSGLLKSEHNAHEHGCTIL